MQRLATILCLMMLSLGLQAQEVYRSQWTVDLGQWSPTHDGDRPYVALIPAGLSRVGFIPNGLVRYNIQYSFRNYRSACYTRPRSIISRDRMEQVEVGAHYFFDRGERYYDRRVDLLVGLGAVSQFVMNHYDYADVRQESYALNRKNTWVALYISAPVMLTFKLKGPLRFEVGPDLRWGVQRGRLESMATYDGGISSTGQEVSEDFERYRFQPVPIRVGIGMLIAPRQEKEESEKEVDTKVNEFEVK